MKTQKLTFHSIKTNEAIRIPDYGQVKAGFPSPAEDFTENSIDLNQVLIRSKDTTFIVRAHGESMKDAGISDGDLLVVDKNLELQDDKVAVCFLDGEFTVKRIKIEKKCAWLVAENKEFEPIKVTEDNELIVWGIVTYIIKKL